MKIRISCVFFIFIMTTGCWLTFADQSLSSLRPHQTIKGFRVNNLYTNNADNVIGGRFISIKHGFIIDLLQIESVPQAFYWIKTPPNSSRGEPHACEHLLLGKGNRGRYVSALEDMALGNSTAYTAQVVTCYHFNTPAGVDTFYKIFEAKLQALLHADFTDEEILREVCHIGVNVDSESGNLSIEEKGTVYTEMVSALEKPWYYIYGKLEELVYGKGHPLANVAGGHPDAMRSMTAQDMRQFHRQTHYLANMGAIVSLAKSVNVTSFLQQATAILDRCQNKETTAQNTGIGTHNFPPLEIKTSGTMMVTQYPSDRDTDPGHVVFAWPATLQLSNDESFMLDLFLETFANGDTSDLYKVFINSQTRRIDIGGNSVWSYAADELNYSIRFGLSGVDNSAIKREILTKIKNMLVDEIRAIRDFEDGSQELKSFNARVQSRLEQAQKRNASYLNSPPMFGFRRGPAGGWLNLMKQLEREPGFRKSLAFKQRFAWAQKLLHKDSNIWRKFIEQWQLLTVEPYIIGASPSKHILQQKGQAKQMRLQAYIEDFKKKYMVDDEQQAIAAYKAEFDAKTAALQASYRHQQLPNFIDNPPLTLDDQLHYQQLKVGNNIPLVASTFANMTKSEFGIALNLHVIPESMLIYVPYLPAIFTEIGVIKGEQAIAYDQMLELLRKDVLKFSAYFAHGYESRRIELVLSGQASNFKELANVFKWMERVLFSPYLSEKNLPRMLDVVNHNLFKLRNLTKRSEEAWVRNPATAYRFQENPLFLSSYCFLTQIHLMQRLLCLLTDPGDAKQQQQFADFCDKLRIYGKSAKRSQLTSVLAAIIKSDQYDAMEKLPSPFRNSPVDDNAIMAAKLLQATLADIPDANLATDWDYLCQQIKRDVLTAPSVPIKALRKLLQIICASDNARIFMISNEQDHRQSMANIAGLAAKLHSRSSAKQNYRQRQRIVQRLQSREAKLVTTPVYVGLLHKATRNGVLVFSAAHSESYDTSTEAILSCLAGKLYSGGGAHGLFMKTWAAGLAYSNGYHFHPASGRVSYYAERCPDIAVTMRFVVNELKHAADNSRLVDYAIAQVFKYNRAASPYEMRGKAMAADLADGITPDKVRTYRSQVLQIRNIPDLYNKMKKRMPTSYGPVMIGYGPRLRAGDNNVFFIIGPEEQFESLQVLIGQTEGERTVYRLYPRDFWLTD